MEKEYMLFIFFFFLICGLFVNLIKKNLFIVSLGERILLILLGSSITF
jgi:hypothetical protein